MQVGSREAGIVAQEANGTVAAGERTVNFAMHCEISQGLRKFGNHSKKFAILAKFSLCENFVRLAKFTVPSENSQFRYLCAISLD